MNTFKVIILSAILLLLSNCNDNSVNPVQDTFSGELTIQVDPRIELLAVIQHFTTWSAEHHTRLDFQYIKEIDEYFGKYSSHSAVLKSQELTDEGFIYDAPPTFVLYQSNPPEFNNIIPYSTYLINRAGSRANLTDFAEKMKAFSDTTNFMEFFNSHKIYYDDIVNEIKATLGETNYIKILEEFYGESKKSYNIIPALLFHSGGYGPQVQTSSGLEVYNICGPEKLVGNKPYFGEQEYLLYLIFHEFSHSFVNPITEKNIIKVNQYSILFEPIKEKMRAQAYNNWQTCVNEHLVRANSARFALMLAGEELKNNYLEYEYQNGFIYIKKIDEILADYEKNRDRYKTYESFYPRILELFRSLI